MASAITAGATTTTEDILKLVYAAAAVGAALAVTVYTSLPEPWQEAKREHQEFELLRINPPKHFKVSLLGPDGVVYSEVSVSKHCNTWRQLQIGQKLYLPLVTEHRPTSGEVRTRVVATYATVCPRRQ